jgi:hypothetical protein
LRPHLRTSFHHQPEAQHPNFQLPTSWQADYPIYWRWKSRNLGGWPQISADLRALIRRMSVENLLWGAPRIHGELLKLGFSVAQSTVAKYMGEKGDPVGQRWSTFLRNHALHIAAMEIRPDLSFRYTQAP